jgi:hypothetical protein
MEETRDLKYNRSLDIWQMGCILFELAVGRKAFRSNFETKTFTKANTQLEIPLDNYFSDDCKRDIRKYVNAMLRIDATRRPNATQLVQNFGDKVKKYQQTSHCGKVKLRYSFSLPTTHQTDGAVTPTSLHSTGGNSAQQSQLAGSPKRPKRNLTIPTESVIPAGVLPSSSAPPSPAPPAITTFVPPTRQPNAAQPNSRIKSQGSVWKSFQSVQTHAPLSSSAPQAVPAPSIVHPGQQPNSAQNNSRVTPQGSHSTSVRSDQMQRRLTQEKELNERPQHVQKPTPPPPQSSGVSRQPHQSRNSVVEISPQYQPMLLVPSTRATPSSPVVHNIHASGAAPTNAIFSRISDLSQESPGGDSGNESLIKTPTPSPFSQLFPGALRAIKISNRSKTAIRNNPTYYLSWQHLCQEPELKAKPQDSLRVFASLTQLYPSNPAPLIQLTNLHAAIGDYKSAIEIGWKLQSFSSESLAVALPSLDSSTYVPAQLFSDRAGLLARFTPTLPISKNGPRKYFLSARYQRQAK